ncbi:Uncharacterised protein [Yersinia frederiksenii]|nr:Uncharacterised protein [Yersinia frederiksenii]
MIKAVLRQIDVGGELLELFYPEEPECFFLQITMSIGPDNENGTDYFNIFLCTPDWLKRQCHQNGFVLSRKTLIVSEYNSDTIRLALTREVEKYEANSWAGLAKKISSFADWEFENYKV